MAKAAMALEGARALLGHLRRGVLRMEFSRVAAVSEAVAASSSRLAKIAEMAELLGALEAEEIEPVVAFVSGSPRQGRIGLGYSTISAAGDSPAAERTTLTVLDVDRSLAALANVTGTGSNRERVQQLSALFARATTPEQSFLR